jgi:hypothetical protein
MDGNNVAPSFVCLFVCSFVATDHGVCVGGNFALLTDSNHHADNARERGAIYFCWQGVEQSPSLYRELIHNIPIQIERAERQERSILASTKRL